MTDAELDWSSEKARDLGRRLGVRADLDGQSLREQVAQLLVDDLRDDSLAAIAGVTSPVDSRMLAMLPGRSRNLLRRLAANRSLDLDQLPLSGLRASELLEVRQVGPQTVADIILAAHVFKDDEPAAHSPDVGLDTPEDLTTSLTQRLAIPPGLEAREMRYRVGTAVLNIYPHTSFAALFPDVPPDSSLRQLSLFQRSRTVLEKWMSDEGNEGRVGDLWTLTPGDVADLPSAGVATVGDICLALDGFNQDDLPASLSEGESPAPKSAIDAFEIVRNSVALLPERERRIYALRKVRRRPKPTLEELGRSYDCTRERIRQIESKVHTKSSAAVVTVQQFFEWPDANDVLAWSAAIDHLGFPPRPLPDWDNVDESNVDEIAQHVVLSALRLEERSGYVASATAWSKLHELLASFKETTGITIGMIRRRLEGFVRPLESDFLASLLLDSGLRLGADGTMEVKPRTQQEAVLQFFERAGRPLTKDEVKEGTGLSDGQARGILQRRGVFSWVGKGVFAPTSWGLLPYEGTETALKDALTSRGGASPVDELIHEVVKRYGCTEVSCRTYLMSSALFERDGDLVTLASGSDREVEPGNPARQRRVYSSLEDGLIWGIDVDEDFLRGSGRSVPPSVAAYVGATRFGETVIDAPGGPLTVKRSGIGIQMSSMRKAGEALSAEQGDRFLLRLPAGGEYRWDLVRRRSDDPHECCLAFVGQRPTERWQEVLARVCWQTDPSLWQETLWDRSEVSLLDILGLPTVDPRGTMLQIEALNEMLEERGITRAEVARHVGLPVYVFNEDAGDGLARLTSVETTLVLRSLEQLTQFAADDLHGTLFSV